MGDEELRRKEGRVDEREREQVEERLPPAARVYLSVWSMGLTPEGKRMRVEAAARLAGVSVSAVKDWRKRIAGFRELEAYARAASTSYVQQLARRIVEGLVVPSGRALAQAVEAGDAALAWNIIKAAGGIASVVDIGSEERLGRLLADLRGMDEEEEEDAEGETVSV